MSNKLILDLTVRLTEALDLNYDVVNMDTVLAVISALEGATITKEQLETTRLAKHINQLRRRNKSNILAIRAKNLLKKWREMFGITSQAQSEVGGTSTSVTSSITQQATSTQQGAKSSLLSISQPVSPNTNTQLLGEQFDNSLSSIGVDFNRTTTATNTTLVTGGGSGSISNTASANFKFNKKSVAGTGGDIAAAIGSRSNGALGKSTNRNVTNNSSPATIANATTISNKVKHPTSFKNLITGFNVHNVPKQTNSSALSPKVLPSISTANERKMFIIDEDHNQSLPSSSTSGAQEIAKSTVVGVTSPRTHKSMKRKERNSPVMTYLDQSSSPIAFENLSHEQTTMATGRFSAPHHPSNRNQIVTSTIDLHDSNSSSNFAGSTEIVSSTTTTTATSSKVNGGCNSGTAIGISSNSSSNKRIRKDKKRSNERELIESEHFEPTIDESSRIAFPISGIQEYLSLSNSSMSIFPAGSGVGGGNGTERFQSTANEDNQPADSSTERDKTDGDLTFAGKFKLNSAGGIDVESSSSYYKGGGGTSVSTGGLLTTRGENNMSVITSGVDGGGNGVAINNTRAGSGMATTSTLGFHPFSRNSNESSSNSRTSQLDLIDVVNQDSESMITVDDLRPLHHQKQSSNEKPTPQDIKFPKDVINIASKQHQQQHQYSSKEYNVKSRQPNACTRSSKPSTPNSSVMPIVVNANASSPPVVEQKVHKKRGRKKGSKGVDSVLAQSAGLNTQFLMSPALGSNKKVKTTRELLIDIQSRKKGSSATSSPTLMNWFGTSRPESSCSEPSLHSPRTFDANSTNATMSIAARSTPEKNASNNSIAADELYESDSDTNTSEPSHKNTKSRGMIKKTEADGQGNTSTTMISSIEEQIKELMAMLPPIDKQKIDWDTCEDVPCTCSLREIPPEVPVAVNVETENTLNLLENVDTIKNEEDDEEPVISVSILPITPQQPALPVVPSRSSPHPTSILQHHHSQSAPVSTVTSPALPPTTTTTKIGTNNQNLPTKSIFDLDFDDDNDPLHMFVEAASRTRNGVLSHHNNRQENSTFKKKLKETQEKDGEQEDLEKEIETSEIKAEHSIIKSQSEQKNRLNKMPIAQQQQQNVATPPTHQQQEPSDQQVMPLFMNFPTYEVVEDPACEAKQRYEIQTNQITKFHINAFHNCYIPNVNGNWDHSMPANNIDGDNDWLQLENDRLYANVVPKYGCLVKERIPKDLSYIKFTSNFKPNLINKKSDKPPPLPFLGVANIHRRQHFHLHHYHRNLKKKEETDKKGKKRSKNKKKKKMQTLTSSRGITKKCKEVNVKEEIKIETKTDKEENQNNTNVFLQETKTNITKNASKTLDNINIDTTTQIAPIAIKIEGASDKIQSEHQESIKVSNSFVIVSGNNNNLQDDNIDHQQKCPNINNLIKHSSQEDNSKPDVLPPEKSRLNSDQTQLSLSTEDDEEKTKSSPLVINGNVPHLMNNNNLIKNEGDNGLSCQKKTPKSNTRVEMNDAEIAASRRSSSCSNSSLKQNQNSINMKLRQHRMETLRLLGKQQKRKRKRLDPPKTNDFEAIMLGREEELQPKVSPLIKRIKLVNGHYAAEAKCPANNMIDSSCLDDNDSDCYHIHSENDITEEEDDPQPEDEDDDDFEEVVDDYDDEEDGDDDDEVEEVCGDFHEVVTRDMTSSATGNNHIVLTIKKTPSKTNSPSSSSMSPAPMLIHNLNANAKISLRQVDDVALLIDSDENDSNSKLELGKLLGLNSVKANKSCLINKTDYFLPESTDVAVYNFQLKKNGDGGKDDNDMPPLPIVDDNDEEGNQEQGTEQTPSSAGNLLAEPSPNMAENPNNLEDKDKNEKSQKRLTGKQENLTKVELAESIRQTKKCFRRIEMKKRLRQGIEQAQKLHRQLFFPYELHNSCGSKILEINSCTSDCTDPSDDDTTDSSDSDSELTTSSSSGNGNLKSRVIKIKRRRRTKLQPGKRITTADGGGNPPSSSSSSSSSSSDSSSSASAFTSWTTSEDDEDDEKFGKKHKQPTKAENMNQDYKVEKEIKPEEEVQKAELPSGNNFLLRSFNHIYVSTEERQRQQKIEQAFEYRQHNEVINNGGVGYITLSGDETMTTMPLQQQNNDGYLNYFDLNSRYNVYGTQTANTSIVFQASSSSSFSRQKPVSSSSQSTVEDTSVDVETIELPSAAAVVVEDGIAEGVDKPSTVILSSLDIDVELMDPIVGKSTSENNSNNPINSDRNVGSINISINNILNNNRIQEISVKTEQLEKTQTEDKKTAVKAEIKDIQNEEDNLVAQEEYRTGIRRVDEDVVDEDGNNCARTQQFKEWHEVLQLRSYNDELLTVLPYVVIE